MKNSIKTSITKGRFSNASEVVRAGLRLLEEEEEKIVALRNAIQEGIDSTIVENFDPNKFLQDLKSKKKANG